MWSHSAMEHDRAMSRVSQTPPPSGGIMRIALSVLVIALFATSAEAQKRCVKGIPCGNSCISASKTCRIGTSSRASSGSQSLVGSAPQATIDRAVYRFVAKQYTDGRVYIEALPVSTHLSVFSSTAVVTFEMPGSTTIEEARELATEMTERLMAVRYTSFGQSSRRR